MNKYIEKKESDLPVNKDIKFEKVQLIDEKGENKGVVLLEDAIRSSDLLSLDLVTVSLTGIFNVPVVKIMNLKKKLYEGKKKLKKKPHEIQLKEIRLSPKIGEHDLNTKVKQSIQFLLNGDKVKIVIVLKGREKTLKDLFIGPLILRVHDKIEEGVILSGKTLLKEKELDGPLGFFRIYFLKK